MAQRSRKVRAVVVVPVAVLAQVLEPVVLAPAVRAQVRAARAQVAHLVTVARAQVAQPVAAAAASRMSSAADKAPPALPACATR
ncbi:hypothetical protein GCM10010987_50040 [Bradyrhizobium guangdongense]|uniref:Uncharacterized protein n=1 Tax=Bradyrhizobium guangdongense TaxID=1325090 RepID=A0AA87W8A3_9BRAD|nr:hypothetical protein GCM10010987_50040 [Bradyrhizobium guangdongense]